MFRRDFRFAMYDIRFTRGEKILESWAERGKRRQLLPVAGESISVKA
jgi:hypothetical protein